MTHSTTERTPPATADSNSPAFLKAVTEMGRNRPVRTSRAIYNHQGIKLLEGGVQIDETLYDRLVSHRLSQPLDESLGSDPAVTPKVLREACEAAMARWPFFALMGPPGRVRSMLLQSIEAIPLPRPVAFHLTLMRETRLALFEHSILMSLLCAHLVREGGAPIHDMTVAASVGLLHDLGMLHIDAELLDSGKLLSGDARRPLYVHPVTSSMLVARFHEYPKEVARAVLEHHERLDGSGYPRGLSGDAISPLGRLLSLCVVVTAMFDGDKQYPEQRVSLLLRTGPRRYDPTLVPSIHRLLRALPPVETDVEATVEDSVNRLLVLAGLLTRLHDAAAASAPALDASSQAVLKAVVDQAETLQRVLREAGVTPEQLALLTSGADSDSALRAELWVLTRELDWRLRSGANQLRWRWRTAAGATPLPPAVASWLEDLDALMSTR